MEYAKVKEQAPVPEYYTLDLLYVKMVNQLDDLRKNNYYCMTKKLIDDTEQSMVQAFRTRSREDIDQFNADLTKVAKEAQNSNYVASAMGVFMIGSVALTLACMPIFLPSYLHMVAMPLWVDITVMSIFCATTVIYLAAQAVKSQCFSTDQFRFLKKQFDQATQGLDDPDLEWQVKVKC